VEQEPLTLPEHMSSLSGCIPRKKKMEQPEPFIPLMISKTILQLLCSVLREDIHYHWLIV
jgi:hypothetical protein